MQRFCLTPLLFSATPFGLYGETVDQALERGYQTQVSDELTRLKVGRLHDEYLLKCSVPSYRLSCAIYSWVELH